MSPDPPTLDEAIARAVGEALQPLTTALRSRAGTQALLHDLGFDPPAPVAGLGIESAVLDKVVASTTHLLEAIADGTQQPGDYLACAEAGLELVSQVAAIGPRLASVFDAAYVSASKMAEELPGRLLDWLLVRWLIERHGTTADLLGILGIVDPAPSDDTSQPRRLRLDRLGTLLSDPSGLAASVYGWGTAKPQLELALRRLVLAAAALSVPARMTESAEAADALLSGTSDSAPDADLADLVLATEELTDGALAAGVLARLVSQDAVPGAGLALTPYASGTGSVRFPVGAGGWFIEWALDSAVQFDAITIVPGDDGRGVRILEPSNPVGRGTMRVGFGKQSSQASSPMVLIRLGPSGVVTASSVAADLFLGAIASGSPTFDVGVRITVDKLSVNLAPPAADGFLTSAMPRGGTGVSFSLLCDWSLSHGLRINGASALRIEVANSGGAGSASPVALTRLSILATPSASGLSLGVLANLAVRLGPFAASISDIGVKAALEGATEGGNLGPLNAAVSPQPPTGVGLSISSEAVNGGGFLRFDPEAGRYAGVFELTILKTVSVKAIAIITTKMPDGSEGFALLILITAQGFTPIQLGMGFSLTGIGGLIALNRTVDADAVRGGLRDGILDSVLFVKDPVKNADRVLTTLDKVFPIARDRLVVGPLAEISWGTPAIVHLRLALLLDLPMPIRAVVLAALSVTLPKPEAPVVEIHVDAIGVLDLAKGQLALDASLHDSRILSFTLTGDMALRLDWGTQPGFLLSVGGFHPRFTPPPGLRPLNRLALQLTNSTNPLVRFEAYLAITSNTLQLGARAMVKLEVGGFGVEGGGSFDTLVQWSPFHLEVDVAAWVKITAGGATILSLSLALSVTGPAPWHLTGTAEFHILFISVSVHVDLTLGQSSTAAAAVDAVDVTDLIWQAISAPASWQAVLPPDAVPGVVIAAAGSDADRVLAHPLAVVSVRQKVAPLGVAVTHVGAHLTKQGPATHNLSVLAADGTNATPVTDLFARAQFTDVPAEQRLSAPSFESFDSGVMLAPAAAASSGPGLSFPAVVDTLDLTSFDIPATLGRPAPAVAGSSTGGGQ